eukprot:m.97828 g.97828  ORF g.97828 m.97828 type:complete len:197 (+) comp13111_c1_seq5:59-649(+)
MTQAHLNDVEVDEKLCLSELEQVFVTSGLAAVIQDAKHCSNAVSDLTAQPTQVQSQQQPQGALQPTLSMEGMVSRTRAEALNETRTVDAIPTSVSLQMVQRAREAAMGSRPQEVLSSGSVLREWDHGMDAVANALVEVEVYSVKYSLHTQTLLVPTNFTLDHLQNAVRFKRCVLICTCPASGLYGTSCIDELRMLS